MKKLVLATTIATAVLAGCASQPEVAPEKPASSLPDWVMNPTIENGLADTVCVNDSGIMNVDKDQAVALARASIAKQIEVKAQAMDETYQRKVQASGENNTGQTFESVSKQVADQSLVGSRPKKVQYIDNNGARQLCVMVTIEEGATSNIFKGLVSAADRQLSAQDEKVLYEEFKAHQAQDRLKAAIDG